VAQSASDGDVTLVRQQIMEARRLWQHTALEEALGELFLGPLSRIDAVTPACRVQN